MDHRNEKPAVPSEVPANLRAKDLFDFETWAWEKGICEFEYDESLDVFRFPRAGP
jgi:hypothetical protein